jgi:hypothetical protein
MMVLMELSWLPAGMPAANYPLMLQMVEAKKPGPRK